MSVFDVIVVGAGPAGASAAIRLAHAGRRVFLVEKDKFPRQKLCGEFISPECLDHFAELGVLDRMMACGGVELSETVFYGRSGRGVAIPSSLFGSTRANALGLSRAQMDLQLMERARDSGVEVREQTSAVDIVTEAGHAKGLKVRGSGRDSSIAAPIILDATGRLRAITRKSAREPAMRAKVVGFKTHVRNVDIPSWNCEIFSYRGGYGGTSRVEGGLYNVCFLVAAADVKRSGKDPQNIFRDVVCSNRRAADVFRDVEFVSDWLAVPIDRFGRSNAAPIPGLLAVGDAAAFIDPFTGSGMLLALESARIAAECILESPNVSSIANEYELRYSAAFGTRLRVCSWLRRASFMPRIAEATILALDLSSYLKERLVRATRSDRTAHSEASR